MDLTERVLDLFVQGCIVGIIIACLIKASLILRKVSDILTINNFLNQKLLQQDQLLHDIKNNTQDLSMRVTINEVRLEERKPKSDPNLTAQITQKPQSYPGARRGPKPKNRGQSNNG